VNQPLLRDFGFDANLAELRISRQNKKISQYNWELKVIDSVEAVMIVYSDMYYAMENVRLKQDYVDANHKLVEANKRRLDLGLMSPIDVRQAQVSESVSQEELVVARNLFMEKQFQLRRAILAKVDPADDHVLVPITKTSYEPPRLARTDLMQEAFQNRVEYKAALAGVEIEDIRVRYARNQVLPKLDLVGMYGYNGLSTNMSRSFTKAWDGQAPQWSVGVVASVPLGNVQARAQLSMAKNSKEQSVLKVKQTELSISVDVDTLISRIKAHQQSVETARQSRKYAEEAVAIEQKRLEEGQVSTLDVVDTQKKWFDARTRELAAQGLLDNSIVQLWVATGTLLQKQSIVLKD
jgi:outer membrane protein TolC